MILGMGQIGVESTMQILVIRLRNKKLHLFYEGESLLYPLPTKTGWAGALESDLCHGNLWLTGLSFSYHSVGALWVPCADLGLFMRRLILHILKYLCPDISSLLLSDHVCPHGSTWKYSRRAMRIIDIRVWVVDHIYGTLDLSLWFVRNRSFIWRL